MSSDVTPSLVDQPNGAPDIARVLDRLLEQRDFGKGANDSLRSALVHVAAHFADLVAGHVNAAPDHHRQSFTRYLGVRPRQPQAARVHLIFKPVLAPRATRVVVPKFTSVASSSGRGGPPPVFETQADLTLVNAAPVKALWVSEHHQQRADAGAIFGPGGSRGPLAANATAVERNLHLAHETAFGTTGLQQVVVQADIAPAENFDGSALEWGMSTASGFMPLTVLEDSTEGMSASGAVTLVAPAAWPKTSLAGQDSRWLTLRPNPAGRAGMLANQSQDLPKIRRVTLGIVAIAPQMPLTVAFHDGMPLDTSKDFFPFGEAPRFGAVLQLLSGSFGQTGARIELQVAMTNPIGPAPTPIPQVSREGVPKLVWEINTRDGFRSLQANDGTRAFTQDGVITFVIPEDVVPIRLGSQLSPCVRARLAFGHYKHQSGAGAAVPTASAPALRSIRLTVTLRQERLLPRYLLSEGALLRASPDPEAPAPFSLFPTADVPGAALYIAFAGPDVQRPGMQALSLQVRYALPPPPYVVGEAASLAAGPVTWQGCTRRGWQDLIVKRTSTLSAQSGVMTLVVPDMTERWPQSSLDPAGAYFWLRAIVPTGAEALALPCAISLNAVEACHSQSLHNENLGSSTGRPRSSFRALRLPILGAVTLEVREDDHTWVEWREVAEFDTAAAADRHFILDRLTGEVRFGDGRHGRIPPEGGSNVRLSYATGGGAAGNAAALTITQLRTTVPGVDSVTNVEPAAGGVDADPAYGSGEEAAAWLRHRDRAICADDYADLALRADPQVAKAYCLARDLSLPTRDLADDVTTGAVRVVVLAHGIEAQPQPTPALLSAVKAYLDARSSPLTPVIVLGPRYASVSVTAAVTVGARFSPYVVTVECARKLQAFLHPLSGGSAGCGWTLNQRPHRSDLYGVLAAVPGVELVRNLLFRMDTKDLGYFVTAAGSIEVDADE